MGFTDRDWGAHTDGSHAHAHPDRRPRSPMVSYTASLVIPREAAADFEIVQAARVHLADELADHVDRCGYTVRDVTWDTQPNLHESTVLMLLHARLVERYDGIWGEIRTAMAEDARDRLVAAESAAEGSAAGSGVPPSPCTAPIVWGRERPFTR